MDFTCALGIQEFGTSHHHSFGGALKNYFNLTESCPGRHSALERSNRKSCFFKLLFPQMSIPPCSPGVPQSIMGGLGCLCPDCHICTPLHQLWHWLWVCPMLRWEVRLSYLEMSKSCFNVHFPFHHKKQIYNTVSGKQKVEILQY